MEFLTYELIKSELGGKMRMLNTKYLLAHKVQLRSVDKGYRESKTKKVSYMSKYGKYIY